MFETVSENIYPFCKTDPILSLFKAQEEILTNICSGKIKLEECIVELSPYAYIYEIPKGLNSYFINYQNKQQTDFDFTLAMSYNVYTNEVDEYIYGGFEANLISIFVDDNSLPKPILLVDLLCQCHNSIKEKIPNFVKMALFYNILFCKQINTQL